MQIYKLIYDDSDDMIETVQKELAINERQWKYND